MAGWILSGLSLAGILCLYFYITQSSRTVDPVATTQESAVHTALVSDPLPFPADEWGPEFLLSFRAGPSYLRPDLVIDLPPPPTSASRQTADEIAYLHSLERKRTPEDQLIRAKEYVDFLPPFLALVDSATTTKPETFSLMKRVSNEILFFTLREKWHYQRARPYHVDPTLTTDVPRPPHASYPSGHAGQSHAIALLLSALDPPHTAQYLAYADMVGAHRELGGVHYPSDTVAGVSLADQVMPLLLQNPQFSALFKKVQADEW